MQKATTPLRARMIEAMRGRKPGVVIDTLTEVLHCQRAPAVPVTNEAGPGNVPDNALARAFRDAAVTYNRRIGATVEKVVRVGTGQPLRVSDMK